MEITVDQQICLKCGFCCDGTLFDSAVLKPGEKRNLPETIKQNYRIEKDIEYFKQPCLCYIGKCSIYNQLKPLACTSFRCQLLRSFEVGKVSHHKALDLVLKTKTNRTQLLSEFSHLSNTNEIISFREMLLELGKKQRELDSQSIVSMEWEIFTAKCNIFESLLIKHFKSEENFQSMVAKEEKEN